MIFISKQNIWTPKRNFGSPKFQKGILHPVGFWTEDAGPVVTLSAAPVSRTVDAATVYAGVTYNATGVEFANNTDGSQSYDVSRGNWLDKGAAGSVYLDYTVQSGATSNITTPGTPRLVMSSPRLFEVWDTSYIGGSESATIDISMWDASTGGTELDSATITLTANKSL